MARRDSAIDVVKDTNDDHKPPRPRQSPASLLSRLPDELLLIIWEYSVISPEPLDLNCPCDSSFGGWTEAYYNEREAWDLRQRCPPWQPALTRVCRSIRADALPMFYKHNAFRAGYCYECDTEIVTDWLKVIGQQNREMLREFYFVDANPSHDRYSPKCLKRVLRGDVVRSLGGSLQSTYTSEACRHDVSFVRRDGEEMEGVQRLFEELMWK